MMRVVLDTNVLLSSFLFRGKLAQIADLLEEGTIVHCFIKTTFLELQRVFYYPKFQQHLENLALQPDDIIRTIADKSIILPDPRIIPRILDDTPDNFILACALAAKALFIVSGDRGLLKLQNFQDIPIIKPSAFLAYFKNRR